LVQVKKDEEAQRFLKKIFSGSDDRSSEHYSMLVKERELDSQAVNIGLLDLFSKKYSRRTSVGVLMVIFFQLTGVFVIFDYATPIFLGSNSESNGNPTLDEFNEANNLTVILGTLEIIASVPPAFLLRCFGRKTILMSGFVVMTITYIIYEIAQSGIFAQGSILLFIMALNCSIGAIAWIYIPEVLPDIGVGFAFLIFWATDALFVFLFPIFVGCTSTSVAFLVFLVGNILGFIWTLIVVKETKDKTNDEIVQMYCPEDLLEVSSSSRLISGRD